MMAKKIEFKVHVIGRVTKEGLPRLVQIVSSLLPGKRLVDPVTEHVFHVPVLLGSNAYPGWVESVSEEDGNVTGARVSLEELEQNLRQIGLNWVRNGFRSGNFTKPRTIEKPMDVM